MLQEPTREEKDTIVAWLRRSQHGQAPLLHATNLTSGQSEQEASQRKRLRTMTREMRRVARAQGPEHAWWEIIADIEAHCAGQPTSRMQTTNEWVAEAVRLLSIVPPHRRGYRIEGWMGT